MFAALNRIEISFNETNFTSMNVLSAIDGTVWAMTEPALEEMKRGIEGLEYRDLLSARAELEDATGNRGVLKEQENELEDDVYEVEGSTAVVPVYGKMFPRANMMTQLSGGVSTRKLTEAFGEIEGRADLERMLMVFDSPGGSIQGLTNAARKVRRMDTETITLAEGLMASAAYFVGSAADQVMASPDSMVGAIGSVATIVSYADKYEEEGIQVEVVRSAEKKAKPNQSEPIDEDSVKEVQRLVNSAHNQFVAQVAINRNLSEETVDTMADGSVITGSEAEDTDFVDDVKTIGEVMAEFEVEDDDADPQAGAISFLKSQYSDLRDRHEQALDHIEDLRDEISSLRAEQRQAEIDQVVQRAVYDEQKIVPAKEDQLRAQLEEDFEATTSALNLMDEGSAAPSEAPEVNADRDDDPVTEQEAIAALRDEGYKVAPDEEAAQTFEQFNQDYVRAENAVEVARDEDLL